ncbi:MAG: glycosyltransferase family 1 protein [Patescibacteria group bacterium]
MNITIDIRCLMQANYSGVSEYAFNLLDNLFKIDSQNQYQLFYNSHQDISNNLPDFNYPNVKFFGFKYPNKFFNLGLKLLRYPKIDKILPPADIFFMPNLNFIALRAGGKKTITIHDLSFDLFPSFFSLKRQLWHKFINPRKLNAGFDKIIAVSDNTKNDLMNLYQLPGQKIKVIHSGLDHNLYKPLDKNDPKFLEIKAKYQLPESFILFLGTLEPRKNLTGIIEAFNLLKNNNSQLADLHLLIAGAPGWNYKKIFEIANNSPYTKQIFYLDYISRQDKPYLYNLARAFIFPSFYEGFGFPALEAQACGLPVMAANNSAFPEILGDSAFLVNPDHLEEIAASLNEILSNQELKQDLINKGLENAKRFSWEKCAQKTLDYLTLNS